LSGILVFVAKIVCFSEVSKEKGKYLSEDFAISWILSIFAGSFK
jgi:hypothetical protein